MSGFDRDNSNITIVHLAEVFERGENWGERASVRVTLPQHAHRLRNDRRSVAALQRRKDLWIAASLNAAE
jgi:hypothetical protein